MALGTTVLALLVLAAIANNQVWYDGAISQILGRVLWVASSVAAVIWIDASGLGLALAVAGFVGSTILGTFGAVAHYWPASLDATVLAAARKRARRARA